DGLSFGLRIPGCPADHGHRHRTEFQSAVRGSYRRRNRSITYHAGYFLRPEECHQRLAGRRESKFQERLCTVLEPEYPAAGRPQHGNHDWLLRVEGYAPGG